MMLVAPVLRPYELEAPSHVTETSPSTLSGVLAVVLSSSTWEHPS